MPKRKHLLRAWKWVVFTIAILLIIENCSFAGTKVGNGDDGGDLEGATPITSGPIFNTRSKAVEKIKRLGVDGIPGLGQLLPEIEKTSLYLAQKDVNQTTDSDAGHTSVSGQVFARTMPETHAATRFFPVALGLGEDQLVALHIHEALHRSLHKKIREDEKIVAKLTLAITAPEANHDSVRAVTKELLPEEKSPEEAEDYFTGSFVGYSYRYFFHDGTPSTYKISSMHLIESHLYPFGSRDMRLGIGIDLSLVNGPTSSNMGPLGLSAQYLVFNKQGFEIGIWGQLGLNTLSAEELKESPYGRDIVTLGLRIRKNLKHAYVENYTSVTLDSETTQKVGAVEYKHQYGAVIDVKIRAGVRVWKFDLGGFTELHLSDYYKVTSDAFNDFDTGRYRILSAGPELMFRTDDIIVALSGRALLNSTKNASFDFLGNLMGAGVAQGSLGLSVRMLF